MDRLPISPDMKRESPDLRKALSICLHNFPLIRFSIYQCCMYLVIPTVPALALVSMKTELGLENGTIVVISSTALVGRLAGYLLMGELSKRISMRNLIVGTHLGSFFAVVPLIFITRSSPGLAVLLGAVFFINGVVWALLLCINSVEMLVLARPGNKIMAVAFCSSAIAFGSTAGTLITSGLLGCTAFPKRIVLAGYEIGKFQFFFLVYTLAIMVFLILLQQVPAVTRKEHNLKRS